jgi:tetratricopeptide (TPR) repeat protein
MMLFPRLPFIVLALALLSGCDDSREPEVAAVPHPRNIPKAEELYRQAVAVIDSDAHQAEALLREAVSWDAYLGKAYNDLGVLLLKQDRLFYAVQAFEAARRNMPGQSEPRVNLALALDRSGKVAEALEAARSALEVQPASLPAVELISLIQLREGLTDETTAAHLQAILSRSPDQAWRDWARAKLQWLPGRTSIIQQ